MAEKTIEKFLARAVRRYEQEQEEPCGSPLLGLYVRRWVSVAASCGLLRFVSTRTYHRHPALCRGRKSKRDCGAGGVQCLARSASHLVNNQWR